MDKKTAITIGIISALIVILVAVVFIMDAGTVKQDKNTIITVGEEQYTIQEFEQFAKILNHEESGDINIDMTEHETLAMLDRFLLQKIYLDAAEKHNITLESGEAGEFLTDYEENKDVYTKANVTKDYYTQYRTESAIVQDLQVNLGDYFSLPDEIYDAIKESFVENDLYKTYEFRLMAIPYEAAESGDVSGDSVDVLETESGDEEDLSREAQLKVAEDVLARLKSGESFEDLAKEYGSTRLTFKGNEYTLVNGEVEYVTSPLLESKLNSHELYDAAIEMNSGDLSEVIEDEEFTTFNILKLESVQEGFVGDAETELKDVLLNEYADDIVAGTVYYEMNQSAYIRSLYK